MLDTIKEGYEVYIPVDAVGGTSVAVHETTLWCMEQVGTELLSRIQLYCELQPGYAHEAAISGFMDVFESFNGLNLEKAAAAHSA